MSLEQPNWGRMHPDDTELAARLRQLPPIEDRKHFTAALVRLAAEAAKRGRGAAVFHELEMSAFAGHRVAMEFLIRLPDPLPLVLTAAAVPVLKFESIPLPLRLAAAGKLLAAVPDDPQTVYPVVQAIALGTSRIRRLERLLHLQRMVETCATLDVIVEEAEQKAKLDCPRCDERLSRSKLIAHLWAKHGLMYHERQAVPPRALLDGLITAAATERTPARIEEAFAASRAYEPKASNRLVFQALSARGLPEPGEVEQLADMAQDDRAGLCPVCLQAVPCPVPPLPPPANLAFGRVSAEGYEARVVDTATKREIHFERIAGEPESMPGARLSRRAAATWLAVAVLAGTAALVVGLPTRWMSPWVVAFVGMGVAFLAYAVRRITKAKWPDADETALATAWAELAPGLGRSERAIRFLMRLTRLSLTIGDPAARASDVYDLAEKVPTLAHRDPQSMQLAAAVRLLSVFDRIRMGRAKLVDAALLFRDVFDGTCDWIYGETLAELILDDAALRNGDDRRLGVMILGLAFDAGWSTGDIGNASRFLPQVRRLLYGDSIEYLAQLQRAHLGFDQSLWERLGGAEPMTTFAERQPQLARQILSRHPDAVLKLDCRRDVESELGPLVLTARGPAIGAVLVDAAMPMECTAAEKRPFRITLGASRIPSRLAVPDSFFAMLRAWAKYSAKLPKEADVGVASSTAKQQLERLAAACPICGFTAIHLPGRLGTPLQGVLGS